MENQGKELHKIITSSDNIVFFGGAGVSTESGIPDFRSASGLFNQKYRYPPEKIVSHSFFMSNTKDFYDFYREKVIFQDAKPNKAHLALAKLENKGKLRAVITQNIDGLHQMAGSVNVLELHGSIHRNYCLKCGKIYEISAIVETTDIPYCTCGGIIRPDVVLYEEMLDTEIIDKSLEYVTNADVLIVGGTSLAVYPAAGLVSFYRGGKFILINKSSTPFDAEADMVINDSIGEVLGQFL